MPGESISLYNLNLRIKELIRDHSAPSYWVVAEISELKVNYSGHCYLELIEKDEHSDRLIATNRAIIWAQNYNLIKAYFETTTGQSLQEGLKVLVKVRIDYHEVYRLSLNILDIEPGFTVGALAIQKQKVIDQLVEEGVFDMNSSLTLPLLCQRIAIISSASAAGYGDFIEQLEGNAYAFKFYHRLFPAAMQGDAAEASIIAALDQIHHYEEHFDAVVIIRGGGSKTDMNCFNTYWLAFHICQFPLPVLTGIGHEQDDSIVDMVAHTRLKTPTAVATFLIERLGERALELETLRDELFDVVHEQLRKTKENLNQSAHALQMGFTSLLNRNKTRLLQFSHFLSSHIQQHIKQAIAQIDKKGVKLALLAEQEVKNCRRELEFSEAALKKGCKQVIGQNREQVTHFSEKLRMLDPKQILQRGYSITTVQGELVKDVSQLKEHDEIETRLWKGKVKSTVKKK